MNNSLGNTAKSASTTPDEARVERYRMQSEARRLLPPLDRVQGCLRWPTGGGNGRVAVKYRRKAGYAYYSGLQTCGQIWKCPVCAGKITERRRLLWSQAIAKPKNAETVIEDGILVKHVASHYRLAMATFTIQHNKGDSLEELLSILDRAYQLTWSGRWAVQYKSQAETIGTVRALEVTNGENGWHPHIHCLFITQSDDMRYSLVWYANTLKSRWIKSVIKAGGNASFSHGVDFRVADISVVEYIDKIGMDVSYTKQSTGIVSEATKYPTKKARGEGAGLFGMLGQSTDGNSSASLNWLTAQRNLKGRRHIAPSKGLLRTLGASQELTDDNLAATDLHQIGDETLALLERSEWDIIDRRELRAQLLNIAQTGNAQTVEDFLVEVGARK